MHYRQHVFEVAYAAKESYRAIAQMDMPTPGNGHGNRNRLIRSAISGPPTDRMDINDSVFDGRSDVAGPTSNARLATSEPPPKKTVKAAAAGSKDDDNKGKAEAKKSATVKAEKTKKAETTIKTAPKKTEESASPAGKADNASKVKSAQVSGRYLIYGLE